MSMRLLKNGSKQTTEIKREEHRGRGAEIHSSPCTFSMTCKVVLISLVFAVAMTAHGANDFPWFNPDLPVKVISQWIIFYLLFYLFLNLIFVGSHRHELAPSLAQWHSQRKQVKYGLVKNQILMFNYSSFESQLDQNSGAISRLNIPQFAWWSEGLHGVGWANISTVFPEPLGLA